MQSMICRCQIALWVTVAAVLLGPIAVGPKRRTANAQPIASTADGVDGLAIEQSRIADKYSTLEQMMIRMAEFDTASNPKRAALLKRAAQQSASRLTRSRMNATAKLLSPPAQLQRAIQEQEAVLTDVQELLELLLSEDRSDRLKQERERIREYIKEVERLLRLQRSVQGETEAGQEAQRLSEQQGKIAERAGNLADRIRADEGIAQEPEDAGPNQSGDENSRDGDPQNEGAESDETPDDTRRGPRQGEPHDASGSPADESPDGQPSETPAGEPSAGEPSAGESSESAEETEPNSSGSQSAPGEGSPQESNGQQSNDQPSNGQQSDQQDAGGKQQPSNPAEQRIEAARQRMREAERKLQEAERQQAVDRQQQARRELELAKAALERILRQLREEEVERMLASLEDRFKQMLETQLRILEETQTLEEMASGDQARDIQIQASKLSFRESRLVATADKVLILLHDEGSSVAFPETVEQMRDDLQEATRLLSEFKVGPITQSYEEAVVEALQELIAALQQAQEDLEQQQQQQQPPPQQNAPGERPLVDQLAELRMIRALQMRVNKRTDRCAKLLNDADDPVGQAIDEDIRDVLRNLAARQERIYSVTRDIVLGKNK